MPFVSIPFTTDLVTLVDGALDRLQEHWEDWEPNDGDLEVIVIEALGPIAQDAIETAALVPSAIFREFGLVMAGEAYQQPQPATGVATFTAIDAMGYDSRTTGIDDEGAVQIALENVAFITDDAVIIPAGQTTVSVSITASDPGEQGNALQGAAELITAISWIGLINVAQPTSGGVDGETDDEYLNRLADVLQLRAKTLVTGRDFEIEALQDPNVGRAVAIVNTARQVTVAITDNEGEATAQAVKDEVAADFATYRQVNTQYNVIDATYTAVNVTYAVVALPSFDQATLKAQIDLAVSEWLDPLNWGRPQDTVSGDVWVLDNTVRYNELLRVLSVSGVRYVSDATLNGTRANVVLPGTVALTRVGSLAGTVT